MDSGFGGHGWAFPVGVTDDGTIRTTSGDEETVRNAIWMILSTSPGERVMRPDYGCGIEDHVFGEVGPATTAGIARDITEALQEWEPRIDLLDVQARQDPGDRGVLLVEITYLMRSTNSRLNLVYPFYLE
ncbi:GPW/gp25 family protein [Frankia sp. CNm7]|uniref:GPW/gp25 family protein n=1 Tax=Frankia nepalensis TaxID=1836974 RepID=A0A937ULZ6_9ACTN|nr:GPW/gp25 family protein [Frankia nepalensis]MBL7494829.1 GPW/gp25 family protein [Frankia nepalensis]MBL7508978.1 GPW/gp25 family protein [Frankia nepalensis]MBL7524782.1 GPW/gp25 family protein [Frankia nepalensis]MBL7626312.1 GPW/gp25 family protein [Frankia nepalensis]